MQVVYTRGVPRPAGGVQCHHYPFSQCAVRTRDKRHAAAPPPKTVASPFTRTPHRYVPDGLSAAQWKKMQADKKKNAAANKLKYPKGAAQVVGVKEYLEDLAKKQTFFRDAAGNSRVGDTGHKWAKVKFGEFTKEAYDEWRAKGGKKLPNQMY